MAAVSAEQLNILVFNVGSSSLSFKLYRDSTVLVRGKAHRVGVAGRENAHIEFGNGEGRVQSVEMPDHHTAAAYLLDYLAAHGFPVDAVGHRFPDGGGYFTRSAIVKPETRLVLESCVPLAPLHSAAALDMVDLVADRLPGRAQYVVFDSTFHAGMPEVARTYALPAALSDRFNKHGFHGLSYAYVLSQAQWYLGETMFKAVMLHLGTGGSSACAVVDGRSVDTSMGYSPLQGLVMNTRCGDLDPGVIVQLVSEGWSAAGLTRLLHRESGLLGLSDGASSDIRDLLSVRMSDERARLAVDLYAYRAKQYVGAYTAAMNGLDVLVFTDDVGLTVPEVRSAICNDLDALGIRLDETRNATARSDRIEPLHVEGARVRILSVPNDEESAIYSEGLNLLRSN
jgi:acetate kinase